MDIKKRNSSNHLRIRRLILSIKMIFLVKVNLMNLRKKRGRNLVFSIKLRLIKKGKKKILRRKEKKRKTKKWRNRCLTLVRRRIYLD